MIEFRVDPDADVGGTSFLRELTASYADLVRRFGPPQGADGYKVSSAWTFVSDRGAAVTLYDYKETSLYDKSLPTVKAFRAKPSHDWHVGARDRRTADAFVEWFAWDSTSTAAASSATGFRPPPGAPLYEDSERYKLGFGVLSASTGKYYKVCFDVQQGCWVCSCRGCISHGACKHLKENGLKGRKEATGQPLPKLLPPVVSRNAVGPRCACGCGTPLTGRRKKYVTGHAPSVFDRDDVDYGQGSRQPPGRVDATPQAKTKRKYDFGE